MAFYRNVIFVHSDQHEGKFYACKSHAGQVDIDKDCDLLDPKDCEIHHMRRSRTLKVIDRKNGNTYVSERFSDSIQ